MQDIHSVGPGGGLFSGRGGGGERITDTASHHLNGGGQVLKCPRCDSLNTKFCYYNNYNLSQPRHYCKSCRRYWTKGGVLRKVPVGGGCRKPKRSSKPSTAKQPASNSHSSSSESSTLTAPNAAVTVDAASDYSSLVIKDGPSMFPDLGGLSGLMTSPPSFEFTNNSLLLEHSQRSQEQEMWDPQVRTGVMDHDDHHHKVSAGGGFGPLDWQGSEGVPLDQGLLYDLPAINTIDQAYWSQSQWSAGEHDRPNLYIP